MKKGMFLGAVATFMLVANNVLAQCTLNGEVIPCEDMPVMPFVFGLGFLVFMLIMALVALVFWVMMIVDVTKNEKDSELITWVLLLVFLGVLGAAIYYFVRKRPRKSKNKIVKIKKVVKKLPTKKLPTKKVIKKKSVIKTKK